MSNLQERLRNVFSILEEHNPHVQLPVWSISDSAVRVPGHSASESEEDVEDHNECVEVLRMVEDEEGEATMACKMPSSSARKAFNEEDEEDEFDRLACESLQRLRCRPKPALKTQVAERNIYDRMTCSASPGSPICPANTPTLAQLAAPTPPNTHGSARKKVRFREDDEFCDAPAITPADSNTDGPSPHLKQRLLTGDAASKSPRETDALIGASPRALVPATGQPKPGKTSYVPEHVRRPQAFTCYELDTPIVVVSGVDGSKDPLTEGSATEQTVLGAHSGRVFQGIQGSSVANHGLPGCLKEHNGSNSVDRRFAGLPEVEYLRASGDAVQCNRAGDTPQNMGIEDDAEPPEMVEFVPGKSSRARARNDLSAEALQVLQSTTSAASTATNSTTTSLHEQRSKGALSVPAAEEDDVIGDDMDTDEGIQTEASVSGSGVQCMQPMHLASGSVGSLGLTKGLDSLGVMEAKPVTMKDGGMVFEFPMDSSQRALEGVGLFGGGVGFVSASASRAGQKNRRGRRDTDE